MNNEAGSGLRLALQRAADGFQTLAHAAQAVAFGSVSAASVVGDFQGTEVILALQTNAALPRLRVPHNVGDGLAQRQS